MADTIKIGNLDISAFKVGSDDCKIYLGNTLLYSGGTTPPTPPPSTELQWVTYSVGDTIPNDTYIFGIKGNGNSIGYNIYGEYLKFTPDRRRVDVEIVDAVSLLTCYSDNPFISEDLEYVLSAISCSNCVVQGNTLSYGGTSIQLLTYPTNPQLVTLRQGDTIPEGYVFGASGHSQTIGYPSSDILQIGTDSDNCVTLGHGAPTRAPEFSAYLYVVSNGTATMADNWMGKSKKVLFPNYSGAQHYYYEDGTKTVPFDVALYMIQIT